MAVTNEEKHRETYAAAETVLRAMDPSQVARRAGAWWHPDVEGDGGSSGGLHFSALGLPVTLSWPALEFDASSPLLNTYPWKLIALHYLAGATGSPSGEDWISYRELPDGLFYASTITREVEEPLAALYGGAADHFLAAGAPLAAVHTPVADAALVFHPLPRVPLLFALWLADDEFPAKVKVMYDREGRAQPPTAGPAHPRRSAGRGSEEGRRGLRTGRVVETPGRGQSSEMRAPARPDRGRLAPTGVVAAGNPSTAAVGADVLRRGGNAADAAVAAACAAMTAEASLTGLGAGGFALVRTPDGHAEVLDFFVAAAGRGLTDADRAARGHLDRYEVPFKATTQVFCVGPSSCATPGMVPGLSALHRLYGRLPLADVVAPAIVLARRGSPLVPAQDYLHDILEGILAGTPGMRAIFAPQGRLSRSGEVLRVPGLAEALETFATEGAEPFIRGDYAAAVADFMYQTGGLVSAADLADYEVVRRAPAAVDYRGTSVLTNPLPSSGGTLIAFTLALLARFPMAGRTPAQRALLLADAFAATDRARRDGLDLRLSDSDFGESFLAAENIDRYADLAHAQAHGNTTHLSVIDADGMTVALTSSCGSGSGVVVEGTGIIMNNMMGEEDLNPGGFFALPPGERLTSMMAPTMAWSPERDRHGVGGNDAPRDTGRDGGDRLIAVGSAGSERLRSAIVQVLVNTLDLDMPARAAVEAPRIHLDRGTVHVEAGLPPEVAGHLEAHGGRVHAWPVMDLYFGGAQIASRHRRGGAGGTPEYDGAGDPRRGGAAIVV